MTTLLIDADTIAYKAALGAEYNYEFGEGATIVRGANLDEAFASFADDIAKIKEAHDATAIRIALTGSTNFRKTILPSYKSKRGPKPLCLGDLKARVCAELGGVIKDGIEADDTVGIWATHPTLIKGRKVIVSIDKDLKTIPGEMSKGTDTPVTYTKSWANYHFLSQVLTGDSADGYKGLPGCGAKGAEKLLAPFMVDERFDAKGAWFAIVEAYKKKGLTADDALVQARVARILRHTDYDYQKKEPILWCPPTSPSVSKTTST